MSGVASAYRRHIVNRIAARWIHIEWVRLVILGKRWTVLQPADNDDEAHVIPLADVIEHVPHECVCGPTVEPVPRDDGSMGWTVIHHSLDGRESLEPDD